jgi:hypothetical protein
MEQPMKISLKHKRGSRPGNQDARNLIRFVCSEIGQPFNKTNESKTPEMKEKITKPIVSESLTADEKPQNEPKLKIKNNSPF